MRRTLSCLVIVSFIAAAVASGQAPAPAKPVSASGTASAPAPAATGPTIDEVLKSVREDLQGARADIMAKNLTLTADQAAKFWPAFSAYQKEQNVIMDAQLKGIHKYIENSETLDDAGALALMQAHLQRDAKMLALRQKWLAQFQKVLPTKLAVRAMQIDRRLSLAAQMEVASQIPLVH
jgi:Spy/CpxP family protein refolding chaperone